jgi:hypothetical protein
VSRRSRQQLSIGAALVAAAGVGSLVAPLFTDGGTASGSAAPSTVRTTDASTAVEDFHALRVSDAYEPARYDRDAFGQAWADTDRNGCDTRNDVLRRDLTGVVTKPGTHGCVVLSGTLDDPYTGRSIRFDRGATSSTAVQIDHRVPLAYAWRHGAAAWTPKQRELFANDQATNLLAVDGPANEAKSDSGPAEWMPANTADACAYAASFVTVATKWHPSIATADEHALDRTLTVCAGAGA